MSQSPSTAVTAYCKPDTYRAPSNPAITLAYDRVVALWQNDGSFGRHIGQIGTSRLSERRLTVTPQIARRLMAAFQVICDGVEEMNCFRFCRDMAGMPSTTDEPTTNLREVPRVDELSLGAIGLVGVSGLVTHGIGYGMGDGALQVLSSGAELGFARNEDALAFYKAIYPGCEVTLHEMNSYQYE